MSQQPIRILHVVGGLDFGGIETMLMTFNRNLDHSRIAFDFVVHGDKVGHFEKEASELGSRIYHIPRFNGRNVLAYILAWNKLLREHPEYQVVHGHMLSTGFLYMPIAHIHHRYVIAHSHNLGQRGSRVARTIKALTVRSTRYLADFFFGCSYLSGEVNFGKRITQSSRFKFWINAIDLAKFQFNAEKREKIRHELGWTECKVIGHVGSFSVPKNHAFLLRAFAQIHKQDPMARLLLLGDGALRPQIEAYIHGQQLNDYVHMTGNVSNVGDYLSAMDMFFLPSHSEGMPVCLMEAQKNGRWCAASIGVPREADFTGTVKFLPWDVDAWVDFYRQLPSTGYDVSGMDQCDIHVVAPKVTQFYRELCVRGRS